MTYLLFSLCKLQFFLLSFTLRCNLQILSTGPWCKKGANFTSVRERVPSKVNWLRLISTCTRKRVWMLQQILSSATEGRCNGRTNSMEWENYKSRYCIKQSLHDTKALHCKYDSHSVFIFCVILAIARS